MGTKLSSPNNRRNHPSSMTANEIQARGGIDVSSRARSRSLEVRETHSRSIPSRRLQPLEISSEDNNAGDDSNGVSNMLHSSSLPSQLFALHGKTSLTSVFGLNRFCKLLCLPSNSVFVVLLPVKFKRNSWV